MSDGTGWSTRQLADIAGTTVKAVRHYHRLGLLDEPERTPNGYKQYRTSHLVRLLQIRRMSELGMTLAQIASFEQDDIDPDEMIRALDSELTDTIERLKRIRVELSRIMTHRTPLDTAPPFETVVDGIGRSGRDVLAVLSSVLDDAALTDLRDVISRPDFAADLFETLPADADDRAIDHAAELLADAMRATHDEFPWMTEPQTASRVRPGIAADAIGHALVDHLNRAQLTALARAHTLVTGTPAARETDDRTEDR